MAVVLSADMKRRKITATVTGLEGGFTYGRVFYWYLNGTLKKTETVMDAITQRSMTFTGVPYQSSHIVRVVIGAAVDDEIFVDLSTTVSDSLALWDWNASNGDATAAQTKTAYNSATSNGLTADFSRLVWNDMVNTASDIVDILSLYWNGSYATVNETLMEAANDPLTATRFNSLARNLQYQYPFWRNQAGREGYLGRLTVYGEETVGDNADIVYGAYLIEIAHILNVLIDAIGEFNAGYVKRLTHKREDSIWTSARLPLRDSESRRMGYSAEHGLKSAKHGMTAPPSRPMARKEEIKTKIDFSLNAPESRHLPITNRERSYRSIDFIAQNERPLNITHQIKIVRDIALLPDASSILRITRTILSIAGVALTPADSLALAAAIKSITSSSGTVLTPSPVTELNSSSSGLSSIIATLATDEESVLAAGVPSGTGAAVELALDASGILAIAWNAQLTLRQQISLSPDEAAQLVHDATHSAVTRFSGQLSALVFSVLAHEEETALKTTLRAEMISPRCAKMQHVVSVALGVSGKAELSSPSSVHIAYSASESLDTKYSAELRAPIAARMAHSATESLTTKIAAALASDLTAAMAAQLEESLTTLGNMVFAAPSSRRMGVDLTETLLKSDEALLSTVDSAPLAAGDQSASEAEALLSTVPSTPLAHAETTVSETTAEMESPAAADGGVVSVVITVLTAALEVKPTVEPTTDWATQEGTNLDIRRTYYNHTDEADGSVLLIDQAWYQEPVQVGANLAITSEGYNDYGLEGTDENEV